MDKNGNKHPLDLEFDGKCNLKAPTTHVDKGQISDKSLLPIKGISYGQPILGGRVLVGTDDMILQKANM